MDNTEQKLFTTQSRCAHLEYLSRCMRGKFRAILESGLRVAPEVANFPQSIRTVLERVYGVVAALPEDPLGEASRWVFAHLDKARNMINPDDVSGSQWGRVLDTYLGVHDGQHDVGRFAEIYLLENLVLHELTRRGRGRAVVFDFYFADQRGNNDAMTDLMMAQIRGGERFQWGIQVTTDASLGHKRRHLTEKPIHDRAIDPPEDRMVSQFMRKNTMVVTLGQFSAPHDLIRRGYESLIGPDFRLPTGLLHAHERGNHIRALENGRLTKVHGRAPSKELGRQFFELMNFFHYCALNNMIVPGSPWIRHTNFGYEKRNGERVTANSVVRDGTPMLEIAFWQRPYHWKKNMGDRPKREVFSPIRITIPTPQDFLVTYREFFSNSKN